MTTNSIALMILILSFLVLVLLRVPVVYAVAVSSTACLLYQGESLMHISEQMINGISTYSVLSIPFFIMMGIFMGGGGISERLIALAGACVGWMKGGTAMANILASYFFGGISGSASADTASIGSILIPLMVEQGYDDDFSTAVTISSSCEGLLVPPSHNMVIYALAAGGVPVGRLFLAGYLPGAILAVALMIGTYFISARRGYPKGRKFSSDRLIKQIQSSIWALGSIIIILVAVITDVITIVQAAAIDVIYSVIVSVYIYKGITWKDCWKALSTCVATIAIILMLISTSSVFGYCLEELHASDMAARVLFGISDNRFVVALLIDLIILILGCVMDMSPIILIATPILLPVAVKCGIAPVQFGVMLILNCGIGLLTPPVGSVLYMGSTVGGVEMKRLLRAMVPFYICMFVVLLIVTYVPFVSMALPDWLYPI